MIGGIPSNNVLKTPSLLLMFHDPNNRYYNMVNIRARVEHGWLGRVCLQKVDFKCKLRAMEKMSGKDCICATQGYYGCGKVNEAH